MKIKRINTAILLLALAGMTLTGCSNEDLANVTPQDGTGNVSFSIVEKDYEPADNTPKSRAAIEETKPEIQDLGDGLMAEVSLVPDTTHRVENPTTRAIATPTHYTIQAFQGGVKKDELKGTFNGSTFTPDAGQPKSISLPHGTYDFVCFNDGVTSNGTQLTVNRADAGTARFDVQRNVQINQDPKQQVKFTMKHAGASIMVVAEYINFGIQGRVTNTQYIDKLSRQVYRVEPANPAEKYTLLAKSPVASVPETMVYDLSTNTYSYPTMGQFSKPSTVDVGGIPVAWSTPGNVVGFSGGTLLEDYWLPTTDCSKLKLTITSGEISGVSLVGKTITVSEHKLVEANKQYIVSVRLYFTDIYIYHDGSSGPLSQNPGKIPVAVLVSLAGSNSPVGIALHDAKVGGNDQIQWNTTNAQQATSPYTNYSDLLGFKNISNTTVPSYLSSTAIQAAQNYSSVVPSITSWQVPAFRDFVNDVGVRVGKMLESDGAFKKFWGPQSFSYLTPSGAAVTGFTPAPSTINFPAMDMTRFNQAFTKVGGTPPSGTYWTSTECKDGSEYKQVTITISSDGKFHLGLKSKTETAKVRPMKLW